MTFAAGTAPAQSIFVHPELLSTAAVLCTTPAGPTRASVTVRLSVDGTVHSTIPMVDTATHMHRHMCQGLASTFACFVIYDDIACSPKRLPSQLFSTLM